MKRILITVIMCLGTGHLLGQEFMSIGIGSANAISGDGRVVVGYDVINGSFYWTAGTGQVFVPAMEGAFLDVTNDTAAVGYFRDPETLYADSLPTLVAGYWHRGEWMSIGGLPGVEPLDENSFSWAYGISGDGSTIVGSCWVPGWKTEAFTWNADSGMIGLGRQGDASSRVNKPSFDGSIMVGWDGDVNVDRRPFMWNPDPVYLGSLDPTWNGGEAYDVSPNGRYVTGISAGMAFLWTPEDSMQAISSLNDYPWGAWGFAVSNTGVVVGQVDLGFFDYQAMIRLPGHNAMLLKDYLISKGVPGLEDWLLVQANGISDDGTLVCGWGVDMNNPFSYQSFVIRLGDALDPNTPDNFSAYSHPGTPTSMTLTWDDPVSYFNGDTLTSFTVEISRNGSPIASIPAGVETYTDNGLTTGQVYEYEAWTKDVHDSTSSHVSSTWMAGGWIPVMSVDPKSLHKTIYVGTTGTGQFTIYNSQTGPGLLDYTITENPAAGWLEEAMTAGTVANNSDTTVIVSYDATGLTSGVYATSLIILGNDPNNTADTVAVELTVAEPPVINLDPDSVHITVLAGQTDSSTMIIHNDGLGEMTYEVTDADLDSVGPMLAPHHTPKLAKGKKEPVSSLPMASRGGPDAFGYKWIDSDEPGGPAYDFIDIASTGTVAVLQSVFSFPPKDEGLALVNLPFEIKFYGHTYNQLQISSNGFVTFDVNFTDFTWANQYFPDPANPNLVVAPFWDDLDGTAAGEIYYQQMGDRFVIQWNNWDYWGGADPTMTFQLILFQNASKMLFVYENVTDNSGATVGIENGDGLIALPVAYSQAYVHDQLLVKINNESEWLSQSPASGTIPPGGQASITLTASATNLDEGEYFANVIVYSNDPFTPDTTLLVHLTVTPLAGVGSREDNLPTKFEMGRNFPNPFNPTTLIKYQLPVAGHVRMMIYNSLGQKVRTLVDGRMNAGYHHVTWDGRNDHGSPVGSGVYIYRFDAGAYHQVRKMLLIK